MEILQSFGVDWKLLLAQLVNFAIVVLVLWRFAIKPLTKIMNERNKEIEVGLKKAQESTDRLTKVENEVKQKLTQARQEADKILNASKQQADKNNQANLEKTKQEVAGIIAQARQQIGSEKNLMLAEVKTEVSQLIIVALEKVLSQGLSKEIDKKYIAKALKDLQ